MMRRATPPGSIWPGSMSSRSRWPDPAHRWCGSSVWRSSRPRSRWAPRPGSTTWATPWSCATGSPSSGRGSQRGELAAWKARRVAAETISHALDPEGAGFVDAHVAPVAHKIRPVQLDRIVEEAIGRFMPEKAEQRRRQAAEGRHFRIEANQISFTGTSLVSGELDLADALDLEDAIRGIAGRWPTSARPNRWTCGVRSPPGSWPAASSPSTSPPKAPGVSRLAPLAPQPPAVLLDRSGRRCCTSTSPKPPLRATANPPVGSVGWRTPAPR